jgi:hypothetical protein
LMPRLSGAHWAACSRTAGSYFSPLLREHRPLVLWHAHVGRLGSLCRCRLPSPLRSGACAAPWRLFRPAAFCRPIALKALEVAILLFGRLRKRRGDLGQHLMMFRGRRPSVPTPVVTNEILVAVPDCAPGEIRTHDLCLRRATLYLRAARDFQGAKFISVLPQGFRNKKGLTELSAKPLFVLVEPSGIEPLTSTMPL